MFSVSISEPIKLVSAAKAAKKLGITSRRLRVLAAQGRVKHATYTPEKGWQFPSSDIEIKAGKRGPALSFSKTTA